MTSDKYDYYSQTEFRGGIETRQEYLRSDQVLDARNYWAPNGSMEQRPGTYGRIVASNPFSVLSYGTGYAWQDLVIDTAGSYTFLANGAPAVGVSVGDIVYPVNYSVTGTPDLTKLVYFNPAFMSTAIPYRVRGIFQVHTQRGWVNVYTSDPPANTVYADLYIVCPADAEFVTLNLGSTYTNCLFRFILTSVSGNVRWFMLGSSAASYLIGTYNGSTKVYDAPPQFLSLSRVQFNTSSKFVGTFLIPAGSSYPASFSSLRIYAGTSFPLTQSFTSASNRPTRASQPASLAVIPEFNIAFVASQNAVYQVPAEGSPSVAAVNTDPLIVGPISVSNPSVPYSSDTIPQLTEFPAANLIVYFKNQLWAAGIQGIGNLIRWSGSSTDGAYNVWPEDNQVTLSTAADNSEITAIATLGDNLVVFKKNSIWQMIDNGLSDNNLPLYEPRLTVAGVGTVSHASVQAVEGGLVFLAEDGFYFYDGTPNIKRISDPIKTYIDRINAARSPFAVATVWRSKQAYMCAVSLNGEDQANNFVFLYDYQNDSWWVWDGWDVQCWLQVDGVGLKEEIWFTDSYGRAYQLGKWTQSDNGAYIDSWLLTGRLGLHEDVTKTSRELRVRGEANNPNVVYNVIGDDIEINTPGSASVDPVTTAVVMPRDTEAQYALSPTYGEAVYVPTRRRERKSPNRTTASWFQVKVRKMLKVFGIDLGYQKESRR